MPALALALALLVPALLPATASAAPAQLWQRCDADEPAGQRCSNPRGIAANPANGHVFVADQGNRRVVEFDALGNFVKAWGWDVVQSGPGESGTGFEVCVAEDGDVCQGGQIGGGVGQFGTPVGVALDSTGNVYIADKTSNRRVQKFDPGGSFLLTFGRQVNKTKVDEAAPPGAQNLCTAASGDVCQGGVAGTGDGEFSWPVSGSFIAIDRKATATAVDDDVYVGDEDRIQVFDTEGTYQESLPLPGETVQSLAVGPEGNLYAVFSGKGEIFKLSPAGEVLATSFEIPEPDEFTAPSPTAVAVDPEGSVYAFGDKETKNGFIPIDRIYRFDPAGNLVESFGEDEFGSSTGLATNLCSGSEAPGNLYVSNQAQSGVGSPGSKEHFLRAYGTDPGGCFNAFTGKASQVAETTARLNGTVNPEGLAVSECRFEYGPIAAYGSSVPCAQTPAQIGTGTDPVPVHADLEGLQAATVHHFRLRATIGGTEEKGADTTFKTTGPPVISAEAAAEITYTGARLTARVNPEGFQTTYRFQYLTQAAFEASGFEAAKSTPEIAIGSDRTEHPVRAALADLEPGTAYRWRVVADNTALADEGTTVGSERAFTTYRRAAFAPCPNDELRSGPSAALPDCRAYEMVSPVDKNGGDIDIHSYIQASPDGERLTYTASPAFGELEGAVVSNQYLAERDSEDGWANRGIRPPVDGRPVFGEFGIFREFMSFSPDLCSAWFIDTISPPLTEEGQDGYPNHYRLDLCEPFGEPEALTSEEPPEGTGRVYVNLFENSVAGYSDDASHAFFSAKAALTKRAAAGTPTQVYDRSGGELNLVSIKTNGVAESGNARVGSGTSNNLDNAISKDGELVYWTAGGGSGDVPPTGTIHLRIHPGQDEEEPAQECLTPASACTVAVSEGSEAFFWAGARDGSGALYSEGDDLFAFDLARAQAEEPPRRLIAGGVIGVLGAADDLGRLYFVSTEALAGEAKAGEPNLYLDEEGTKTFVAALSPEDVLAVGAGVAYTLTARDPAFRPTRVSPDGAHLAFQSRAPLTGFDNTDPVSGEPNVEVFRYAAGEGLRCVSCNPSGAAPQGAEMRVPYSRTLEATNVFAAAWIPTWEHSLHASRVLSDDGARLFFHSHERLLPADTNGAMDVYQWEEPGTGSCTTASPSYFPANGGCIHLISSGQNAVKSEFFDASADGSHVFFNTEASLLPRDPGLIDLYDAHVGGGFPEAGERAECEGDACQSPPAPPRFQTPASASFSGPGSASAAAARRPSCRRAARRAGRLSRRARRLRRAARKSKAPAARRKRAAGSRRLAKRARALSGNAKRCRAAARRAGR